MPAGRPTSYDPSYCDLVIEMGKRGYSKVQIAAELGIAKSTLPVWEQANPEFSDALTRAMTFSQSWWEQKGQDCLIMPGGMSFQSSVWSRSMAARFPDDWREKTATELSGPNGSAIKSDTAFRVEFVAPPARKSEE